MDLNIRNIPEHLMRSLKSAAVERGVTLREHCLSLLSNPMTSPATVTLQDVEIKTVTKPPPATPHTKRGAHDKKTCRVYKCGLCASDS